VLYLDESLPAHKIGMVCKSSDSNAVVLKGDKANLIPVEMVNEHQLRSLARERGDWIIPVFVPITSWPVDHDGNRVAHWLQGKKSKHLLRARSPVIALPDAPKYSFAKEDFADCLKGIDSVEVRRGTKTVVPHTPGTFLIGAHQIGNILHFALAEPKPHDQGGRVGPLRRFR